MRKWCHNKLSFNFTFFFVFFFLGFLWTMRQAGSSCGPVWTMNWCGVSRWPCWRGTVAARRPRGGSAWTWWTSTTTRRSSRRRRTWAPWERTNRRSSRWHESGWDVTAKHTRSFRKVIDFISIDNKQTTPSTEDLIMTHTPQPLVLLPSSSFLLFPLCFTIITQWCVCVGNRLPWCVGHQSLPHERQRYTGTMVTNGSAFPLIELWREMLQCPLWQQVQLWLTLAQCTAVAHVHAVAVEWRPGLNAWLPVFD